MTQRTARRTAAILAAGVAAALSIGCAGAAWPTARAIDSRLEGGIAVIGDFGTGTPAANRVADLVNAQDPIAVVTVGDNVYGAIGYPRAIAPYCRYLSAAPPWSQCPASSMPSVNRFFPAAGNHDYSDGGITAFQDMFVAARSRTWYSVVLDGIEFLVLDSQAALDDPASMAAQRGWAQRRARESRADWQVVVLHHPPYSSSTVHGSTAALQWPFTSWGVDLVLAGHDHGYERLQRWGLTYVVNGASGAPLYRLGPRLLGSIASNDRVHGALFLRVVGDQLLGEFRASTGQRIDAFRLTRR